MTDLAPEFAAPTVGETPQVGELPAVGITPPPPAQSFDDYVFVRFPDGSLRAVPKAEILATNGMGGFESVTAPVDESREEFYVHLADGSVERVKHRDLPAPSGTNAPHGYFIRDNKAYVVTGVFPVETNHSA